MAEKKDNRGLWEFDASFGLTLCGVDEAGRGPLAGPVFAACAILRPGVEIPELNDSKKLTEKCREAIFEEILGEGKAWLGQLGQATWPSALGPMHSAPSPFSFLLIFK